MADARRHWLVDLAIQAGLPGSDSTVVDPGASLPDAWTAVGRAAGVSDADLASRVATRHRLAVANLETAEPAALTLVPEKTARRYLVYPLRATDRQLVVALAQPGGLDAMEAPVFAFSCSVVRRIAAPEAGLKFM